MEMTISKLFFITITCVTWRVEIHGIQSLNVPASCKVAQIMTGLPPGRDQSDAWQKYSR